MAPIRIRYATLSDVETICSVHKRSISELCAEAYSQDQIDSWAGPRKPQDYVTFLRDACVLVTESSGCVIGFAILSNSGELHALYVHPSHVGLGTGSQLLEAVEEKASHLGLEAVTLNATLNSVTFYKEHGYLSLGESINTLPSGIDLPCVRMKKVLTTKYLGQ